MERKGNCQSRTELWVSGIKQPNEIEKKMCLKVKDHREKSDGRNWIKKLRTSLKYFRFTTKSFISECEFMALLRLFSSCLFCRSIRIIHFTMIAAQKQQVQIHTHTHTSSNPLYCRHAHTIRMHEVATMRKIASKLLKNSTWLDRKKNVHTPDEHWTRSEKKTHTRNKTRMRRIQHTISMMLKWIHNNNSKCTWEKTS